MSTLAALLRPATEKLVELGKVKPGQTVLDLGARDGPVSVIAARHLFPGGRLVVVDRDGESLAAARHNVASAVDSAAGRVEFEQADLRELDIAEGTFDVVFSQFGIDTASDPEAVAAEALRVLKPGGRLALLGLGAERKNSWLTTPYRLLRGAGSQLPDLHRLFTVDSHDSLSQLLTKVGFIHVQAHAVGVMLEATDAESLWSAAAAITNWPAREFELIRPELAALCRGPGGARWKMEILIGLAHRPVDDREAARPRSFDDLVASLRSRISELSPFEARRGFKDRPTTFLDVREAGELAGGTLPNALRLPRGVLEQEIGGLIPDMESSIIVYSEDGRRSALAALRLQELGYSNVWNLTGGIRSWLRNGYETQHGSES